MRERHVTDELSVDDMLGMRLAGMRPWYSAVENHEAHKSQILCALPAWRVIIPGAGQSEELAPGHDGTPRMAWFDEHTAIRPRER